jgi:hypothetical protein
MSFKGSAQHLGVGDRINALLRVTQVRASAWRLQKSVDVQSAVWSYNQTD